MRIVLIILAALHTVLALLFGILFLSAVAAGGFDQTIFQQIGVMVLALIATTALVGAAVCASALARE